MQNIYLVVGRSGSGKDTVVDYLCNRYGYKRIISYTTRPRRNEQDKHIFVSDTEFDRLQNIVAFTDYGGHRYCATAEQVEEADLYIIDPAGVEFFKRAYKGGKSVKVIGMKCSLITAFCRMLKRGDGLWKALKRVITDIWMFRRLKKMSDFMIDTDDNVYYIAGYIRGLISCISSMESEENKT